MCFSICDLAFIFFPFFDPFFDCRFSFFRGFASALKLAQSRVRHGFAGCARLAVGAMFVDCQGARQTERKFDLFTRAVQAARAVGVIPNRAPGHDLAGDKMAMVMPGVGVPNKLKFAPRQPHFAPQNVARALPLLGGEGLAGGHGYGNMDSGLPDVRALRTERGAGAQKVARLTRAADVLGVWLLDVTRQARQASAGGDFALHDAAPARAARSAETCSRRPIKSKSPPPWLACRASWLRLPPMRCSSAKAVRLIDGMTGGTPLRQDSRTQEARRI
jgi:hypothetical protein